MDGPRSLPRAARWGAAAMAAVAAVGVGVVLGMPEDDAGPAAGTSTTVTTAAPTSTTAAPARTTSTTARPSTTPTTPPDDPDALAVGEPDGFTWPSDEHPAFPFPAPSRVRGRIDDGERCDRDDEDERCLLTYAFTVELDERDRSVDEVIDALERFAPAAGWTPTEPSGDGAEPPGDAVRLAFSHACDDGDCAAFVQLEVRQPRRNRSPELAVVVTLDER